MTRKKDSNKIRNETGWYYYCSYGNKGSVQSPELKPQPKRGRERETEEKDRRREIHMRTGRNWSWS
jgi:hypothetical protein